MFGEYSSMFTGIVGIFGAPLLVGIGVLIGLAIGVPVGKWLQSWG
jgi:hypothetical protein